MKQLSIILLLCLLSLTVPAQTTPLGDFIGFRTTANTPNCRKIGTRFFDTTLAVEKTCTVIGTPGTWTVSSGLEGKGLDQFGFPNIANFGTRIRVVGQLAAGNNDVYTVPAGYQFLTKATLYWGVATGYTIYSGVKEGANYRRLSPASTVGANASRADIYQFALESNEVFFMNSTAANVRYQLDGFLIPNTGLNIVRPWATTITAATDTLLYTTPANTVAYVINPINALTPTAVGNVFITNDSGASGTITGAFVPSGGTIGSSYYTQVNVTNSTGSVAQLGIMPATLSPGDRLYFNDSINNAGQVVYTTILEVPQ